MISLVICLDGLGKHFGHTIAVDGISMVIGKGEIFGIQARDPEALLDGWLKRWHMRTFVGWVTAVVEPDMEDVFMAQSQRYVAENGFGNRRMQTL